VESIGVAESRLAVLPNSVDLRRIRKHKAEAFHHPAFADLEIPVLMTAGRLVYQKGIDILIKAMALLIKRHDFRLVILGEGPERPELERLAIQHGLANKIFFLGFQKNPWRFFGRATAFVLSSRYEGFGNVLIEAMACGAPIVTTAAPFGPEYIIGTRDCGLIVPVDDPSILAQAVEQVLTDGALRARLAAGGMRRAEDFDVDRVFDTFWSHIQTLVAADT
jgi:glycosyltransferase involved in cell wall biosynthesis